MKKLVFTLAVALCACGGGNGGNGGTGGGSQNCTQRYACTNGACSCSEGPKQGSSCCNPSDSSCTTNVCDSYCRYCQ